MNIIIFNCKINVKEEKCQELNQFEHMCGMFASTTF